MVEGFDHSLHCDSKSNWSELHTTAQKFLEDLNLSTSHPRCHDEASFSSDEFIVPSLNELPTDFFYEQEMSLLSRLFTVWCKITPALLAMGELWLRLCSFVLAPSIALYLITRELSELSGPKTVLSIKQERNQTLLIAVGLASSLVLLTDSLYVHSYDGRQYGASFFFLTMSLAIRRWGKFRFYKQAVIRIMLVIMALTSYLFTYSERQGTGVYDDPGLDLPTVKPGFYYSKNNELMSKVAEIWPAHTRTYDVKSGATSYLPTGDSLTGIPFLINKSEKQTYHRVWVQNNVDNEAVALDIKFPTDGVHNTRKPIFLILHGLNGGSNEEFVQDFIERRATEGHTCIVMIARGFMDTPVVG